MIWTTLMSWKTLQIDRLRGDVQPGSQGQPVLDMPPFLAPEFGGAVMIALISRFGVGFICRGSSSSIEQLISWPEEGAEVEIGGAAEARVQCVGGLEKQVVFEETVHALVAGKPDGDERGAVNDDAGGRCFLPRESAETLEAREIRRHEKNKRALRLQERLGSTLRCR